MKRFVFIFSLVAAVAPAIAATRVEVDPSALEFKVPAGGSYAGVIKVINPDKEMMDVTSDLLDWEYERPDGSKKMYPSGTTKISLGKWIRLSPAAFKLQPRETKEVQFSVAVPTDAAGGYYSLVLFSGSSLKSKPQNEGVTIGVNVQMGTVLLLEVENTQAVAGKLKDLKVLSAKPGRELEVEATFKNEGNMRINARGRLSILDQKGNAVGWTKFPSIKTLPGQEWSVKASAAALQKGKYKLIGTFELAPGKILVKEKEIEVK